MTNPEQVPWVNRSDKEKYDYIVQHDGEFAKHHRDLEQFNEMMDRPQVMSLTTFDYYAPLFSYKAREELPHSELMAINRAYWANIDPYKPIIVQSTDPSTGKPLDLFTLPRLFTQMGVDGRLMDGYEYAAAIANLRRQDDPISNKDGRFKLGDYIEAQHTDHENLLRVAQAVAETKHIKAYIDGIREGKIELGSTAPSLNAPTGELEMDFYED